MAHDIFVSYSTQDKLFVDALVHRLEDEGYRCWYAPRDIAPGLTWPAAIAQAIKEIPLMLLVFSSSSNASEEISRELTLASGNKTLVLPVRIENVTPSVELEYHLANRHWLDVYGLDTQIAITRVLEGLEGYTHLFPSRGGDSHPLDKETIMTGAAGSLTKKPLNRLPFVAVLLIALSVGGYFAFREPALPDHSGEMAEPSPQATIFRYATTAGKTVTVYSMRLAPRAEGDMPEEYLVALTGIEGPHNGRIFRCRMFFGSQSSFSATIDGEPYTLFKVDHMGRGFVYPPGSNEQLPLEAVGRDGDPEKIASYVRTYLENGRWPGTVPQ